MIQVFIITGRTIKQGILKECEKLSEEYKQEIAVCYLSPNNMKILKISDKDKVKVKTKFGEVVLYAKESQDLDDNSVFIPYGIWANLIMSSQTESEGMPSSKGIRATIEPTEEEVLSAEDILRMYLRRF